MELSKWKPFGIALIATPLALLVGLFSAGAGHGDYFWVKIFFPYTMLSTIPFHSITSPFLVLAVAQFPLYGLTLTLVRAKRYIGFILAAVHCVSAILCLILIGENFS
jgi:hypothetical protein